VSREDHKQLDAHAIPPDSRDRGGENLRQETNEPHTDSLAEHPAEESTGHDSAAGTNEAGAPHEERPPPSFVGGGELVHGGTGEEVGVEGTSADAGQASRSDAGKVPAKLPHGGSSEGAATGSAAPGETGDEPRTQAAAPPPRSAGDGSVPLDTQVPVPEHRPYLTRLSGGHRGPTNREVQALRREVEELRDDNQELKRTAYRLHRQLDEMAGLQARFRSVADRYNALLYAYEQLERQVQRGETELERARRERDAAREKENVLEARVNRLMRQLAEHNRSRTGTSTSSDRPRTHLLLDDFKLIRDQLIVALCHDLVQRAREDAPIPATLRKERISRLRAVFARELLLRPTGAVQGTAVTGGRPATERSGLESEIEALVGPVPGELIPSIRTLAGRTGVLLQQMAQTDPPGCLVSASPGDLFDPALHAPTIGSLPGGSIELVIFPGYRVEDFLHEKVLVRTISDGSGALASESAKESGAVGGTA
jgi:hypothetical protein